MIEIREAKDEEIEKIVLKYLKENKDKMIYPSDIAFEYYFDAKQVIDVCREMVKQGKLIWKK